MTPAAFVRWTTTWRVRLPEAFSALPLRAIVGYGFFAHGEAKLSRGVDGFAAILAAIGMPAAIYLAWATVIVEIVGGLMVLAGLWTPFVAAPMAVVLVVAIFSVHLPNGFSSIKLQSFDHAGAHFGQPGYEADLLYLAALAALCIVGSGPFSVDGWLRRRIGRQA